MVVVITVVVGGCPTVALVTVAPVDVAAVLLLFSCFSEAAAVTFFAFSVAAALAVNKQVEYMFFQVSF